MTNRRVFKKGDKVIYRGKSYDIKAIRLYAELFCPNDNALFVALDDPDLKFDIPRKGENKK